MTMDASNRHAVVTHLADGPLAGQRVIVHATRGGALPVEILPHAPLGPDHVGEPRPRHSYHLAADRLYRHCVARCPCGV